jgi:hypothetical protein
VYSVVIINSNASADLTLTPGADTVLTFSASTSGKGIKHDVGSTGTAHSIKIGGAATLIPGSTYTVASEASKTGTLEIDTGATLELAAGALATEDGTATQSKLVLTGAATANAATLIATGDLIAGATTITGTWKAVDTETTPGNVTIVVDGRFTSSITASRSTVTFTAGTDGTITQAADEGNELTIATDTVVDLGTTGSLVLTGAATTGGAKLSGAGTGSVKAAETTITGTWQAVGVADTTVTITATSAAASSITASADTVALTAGTGGTITQAAGTSGNALSIGEATTIILGGTATEALGKLILTGGTNPAKLVFAKTTSFVQVGATFTSNSVFSAAATIGGKTFGGTSKPGVYTSETGAAGTFLGLKAAADNNDLIGGTADNTITIDSTKAVA